MALSPMNRIRLSAILAFVVCGTLQGCFSAPPVPETAESSPGASLSSPPLAVVGAATTSGDGLHDIVGAILAGDTLIIADGSSRTVRFYSSHTGQFLYSIGGEGDGPGEFADLSRIWQVDASIYVWDRASLRLTEFNMSGALIGSVNIELSSYTTASVLGVFPDGTSLVSLFRWDYNARARAPMIRRNVHTLARYDADGTFADSLGTFLGSEIYVEPFGRGGEWQTTQLFGRRAAAGVLRSSYYVIADTGEHIEIFDRAGVRTNLLDQNGKERVPVTGQDVSRAAARESETFQEALAEGRMSIPKVFPKYGWIGTRPLPTMRLTRDPDAVWLLEYGGIRDLYPKWIVYLHDGSSNFQPHRVTADEQISVLAWDGSRVAVKAWDELDVERVEVRRFRLP